MESDKKVNESLDTFIRQTMGREPYMSFISRPGEKPLQRIIEHQHAMNKCVKSLKVDINICDGLEDNAYVEPHQDDIERDFCGIKGGGSLGRGLQTDRNLQTIKNNIPQAMAAFAASKNPGKQNTTMDCLTDLPGWPLLSPSKVQLQKCDKCSREFFSSFNHRRHTRTHRRISHVDKEDLQIKRKNVAAFWNKLNQDDAQQIFASSRKYNLEDLSLEVVVSHLLAFKKQNNPMILPPAYIKAGQDLLDMLDNKQIVFPLFSEQILSILDEASEKTFLCSQGDLSKIGLEEKNLIASLGFIIEQALVKAWMADKDAEALRNQQELVKEEEAAQMKRERIVAKKKKKKEKSRQKGLKERKVGVSQLALNEENESVDGENPSLEIVEEDNSPTASSTSLNSFGLENPLIELLEMDVDNQVQNNDGRIHNVGGEDRHLKSKDILSTHVTFKKIATDSVDKDQMQQSECNMASYRKNGERCSNFLSYNQVKVKDQEGRGHVLEQNQSIIESRKRTLLKPYRELTRVDYQDSYQRGGWVPDPRFQGGIQQNSYRAIRKSLIGTPHTSNNELGSNTIPGFYRGKSMSLRGIACFSTTQQWTKKAQTPTTINQIMDGHEEENSQEYGTFTSKSNAKVSTIEDKILAREMETDTVGKINKTEKEEFRTLEMKEPLPTIVPSVAKVVASTGGLSNMPTTSFNLNVNSEEWPPLSNSHATYYPKNTGMYSLTSYQCGLNSRLVNKFNIERGSDHHIGLESKVERSIITSIPPVRGSSDETTTRSVTVGLQKGIMIGSVTVPLGDYVRSPRPGLGSIGRRICNTSLPVHQSYTAVLVAPPIRYTQDSMASTIGRQEVHDRIYHSEFADSSNVQVMDSHGGPSHFKTLSLRSTPSMNLNIRHVKGSAYLLRDQGERGIFFKQPSWSGGPIRHLPQKVWRPVRLTTENANSNPGGKIDIESSLTSAIEKISEEHTNNEENKNATLSLVENIQVQDINIKRIEQYPAFAIDFKTQGGDRNHALDLKNKNDNVPQVETNCDASIVLNNEHLQYCQETSGVISNTRVDDENGCQLVKNYAIEQNMNYISHAKIDNTKKMDDKAHMEFAPSHSTWVAEAIEFHLNRWQSALKDPETIVGNCEEKHPKLQTSKWIDFMDSLPSIITRLTFWKEDCNNPLLKTLNCSNQIGTKSFKNLPNGQRSIYAKNSRHEGSRAGSQAVSSGKKPQDSSLFCESGSPCAVTSTPLESVLKLQNYGKCDTEGRFGSRSGSSCSDSNISSNSGTDRRDWMGVVNAIHERLQEKQHMPKEGHPKDKKSC